MAGRGRATVYRHCPTTEALLDQALDCMDVSLPEAEDETLASQLAIGRKMARDLYDPAGAALLLGLMERAHHDPECRDRQAGHIGRMLELLREVGGEGLAGADLELLVAQVLGPVVFRGLVAGRRWTTRSSRRSCGARCPVCDRRHLWNSFTHGSGRGHREGVAGRRAGRGPAGRGCGARRRRARRARRRPWWPPP